jgi:hypothetical protein
MAERKSVLANYELRQTMGELGWLALDSEYEQAPIANARYEEFTRYLATTLRTLKEQQGLALAAQKAHSKTEASSVGEGAGDVGRMAASNKAGRREAQTSRRERQLQKLKDRGPIPAATATQARQPAGVKDQRNTARKLFGASPAPLQATTKRPGPLPSSVPPATPQGSQQSFKAASAPQDAPKQTCTD